MFETKPENYGRDCVLAFLRTGWFKAPQSQPQERAGYPHIVKAEVSFDYHSGIEYVIKLSNGEIFLFKGRKL